MEEQRDAEDSLSLIHAFQVCVCVRVYLFANYVIRRIVHRISCEVANTHTRSVCTCGSVLDYMA